MFKGAVGILAIVGKTARDCLAESDRSLNGLELFKKLSLIVAEDIGVDVAWILLVFELELRPRSLTFVLGDFLSRLQLRSLFSEMNF